MTAGRARLTARTGSGPCHLLAFEAAGFPLFLPGQYLTLHIDDGNGIPFSIASLPAELPTLRIHFVPTPGSDESARVVRFLATGHGACEVSGPFGECVLDDVDAAHTPLLFVAAGSGIAQCQVMVRALPPRTEPTFLYWGVRDARDLYLDADLRALAAQRPELRYQAIVGDPAGLLVATECHGRKGLVGDAIIADGIALAGVQAVISGSHAAVHAIVDQLLAAGLRRERVRSDMLQTVVTPTRQ